jgi:hypothetical protein
MSQLACSGLPTPFLCRKAIPVWVDITARIESDEDAKKKLG